MTAPTDGRGRDDRATAGIDDAVWQIVPFMTKSPYASVGGIKSLE
jgi:hypothetical protein